MSEDSRIETARNESLTVRAGRTVRRAIGDSRLVDTLHRLERMLGQVVRDSRLYQWLTTEPDPTVVTIDLRETYTVGPVLKLLERLTTPILTRWTNSTLEQAVATLSERGQRLAESSRTVKLLAQLFVPPEPPEDRDRIEDARDDN